MKTCSLIFPSSMKDAMKKHYENQLKHASSQPKPEDWQGGDNLPLPPWDGAWLLPASDHVAMEIAERQKELREARHGAGGVSHDIFRK